MLPDGLTHLDLGYFNHPVFWLPAGLTHLVFGDYFNRPLPELPAGLTHLKFGDRFNQPLNLGNNVLPAGLTHLTFGDCFKQPEEHICLLQTLFFFTSVNSVHLTILIPVGAQLG